jgi:anti-sigma factor ChrR (cupin superfamily)
LNHSPITQLSTDCPCLGIITAVAILILLSND